MIKLTVLALFMMLGFALAGSNIISAQELTASTPTPGKGTYNSIYHWTSTWTYGEDQFPWATQFYTLSSANGEVFFEDSQHILIKYPSMRGVDNNYEIWNAAGQAFNPIKLESGAWVGGVNQASRISNRYLRLQLRSPITGGGTITVRMRQGAYRVVEANIPVDPGGDGQTFYTRAAPIVGVTGVFGEDGTDYYELPPAVGQTVPIYQRQTGSYNSAKGTITLPAPLPSRVRNVRLVYWVGPVVLSGCGSGGACGGFTDSEGNRVPLAAGWDGSRNPRRGSAFIVSGSMGLNLRNNPRGVPGLNALSGVGHPQGEGLDGWSTRYIKYANGAPAIVTDEAQATVGRFDTASFPPEPPLNVQAATTVGSNSTWAYPTVYEVVGVNKDKPTVLKVTPPSGNVIQVLGVWDNPSLAGVNYYNEASGSIDSSANIINLATTPPLTAQVMYAYYAHTGSFSRFGFGISADRLIANPDHRFQERSDVWDPLIAEDYIRDRYWRINPATGGVIIDTSARKMLRITTDPDYTDTDKRMLTPLSDSNPDDGNSSTNFAFRARYFNTGNLPPLPWLPFVRGYAGNSGVYTYIKFDGEPDFRIYGMAPETPGRSKEYDVVNVGYPGDVGVGYLLRMEPVGGWSAWATANMDCYPVSPFVARNNYISLPVGRHSYLIRTADDYLYDRGSGSQLYQNPLINVSSTNPADSSDSPFWTEQRPPVTRVGQQLINGNLRDTYSMADLTTLKPGPLTGYGNGDDRFNSDRHPVVHALLSGKPFGQEATGHLGGMYNLGTCVLLDLAGNEFVKWGVHPSFKPPCHGATAGVGYHCHTNPPVIYGTSGDVFTFQVYWQSFDPTTKVGRAPQYIKLFINNKASAKPTLADNTTPDPDAYYVGFSMTPVKANPTADDYKNGLLYQVKLGLNATAPPGSGAPSGWRLKAGSHTYYFEADVGFGPVRFPVRPDGRKLDRPTCDDPDKAAQEWWEDAFVPGDEDFADNNDYCPGPFINTKPELLNASVTPSSGPLGTDFIYRVTYKDPDNQRPYKTDIYVEVSPGRVVRGSMVRAIPGASNYSAGVEYIFRASTLQGSVLEPGNRRFRFAFSDDWGHPEDTNDKREGETVMLPQATGTVTPWFEGPIVTSTSKPLLTRGSVVSTDGSSNSNTVWNYQVTYTQATNRAPSYMKVYLGSQRHPQDPANNITLQRIRPTSATTVRTLSVPVLNVTGVWGNADGSGVNFYTGGSFDTSTGLITLGRALTEPSRDVWVSYSANPITWDDGHAMSQRDPSDTNYRDGAVFEYKTTLPGAQQQGDRPITYYYTFQASDGEFVTRYDASNSASAFALTRQPGGEGVTDTGEFLNHGASIDNRIYTTDKRPIVGPLPLGIGVLTEPRIFKNNVALTREFTGQLDSASSGVSVDPGGSQIFLSNPNLITSVLGVWDNPDRTGTNYYAAGGRYNSATGTISLGAPLPAGLRRVFIDYYNAGDYRIDFVNGKVVFTRRNLSTDQLEMEYWWAAQGPSAVGVNTPPTLTRGRFVPDLAGPIDGNSQTTFTFTVTYTDTDGPIGQAPAYVRVNINGRFFDMTQETPTSTPIWANGVSFRYTTTLAGGTYEYFFEASDGVGIAVFDADGPKSSGSIVNTINISPLPGPVVNDEAVLSAGIVTPNPTTGLAPGNTVTYTVNYLDRDGDAPNIGYPRVWIDNPNRTEWGGAISAINGTTLTIQGANFTPGELTGKLLQVTSGLVSGGGSAASGKIFPVFTNTANTVTIAASDIFAEGLAVGDTVSIGWLVMSRSNNLPTDFKTDVEYRVVVPVMPIGNHTYSFTVTAPPLNTVIAFPATGVLNGPRVRGEAPQGNRSPVLSSPSYSPTTGLASTEFQFRVSYSDADNDPAAPHGGLFGYVQLVFDNGAHPPVVMQPISQPVGDWTIPVPHIVTLSGLPAGTHPFHFEASDGYRDSNTVTKLPGGTISINSKPVLSIGAGQGVTPVVGSPTTQFTWEVTYTDVDNDAPGGTNRVTVVIDGTPYLMAKKIASDNNYTDGVSYIYKRTLALGSHSYQFIASDAFQDADPTPVQSGPTVLDITAPHLNAGEVTPATGPSSTGFIYSVKYRDASGQPAASVAVVVDNGTPRAMTLDSSYGVGGVDSEGYRRYKSGPVTLGVGGHSFYFTASNGQQSVRFPETGSLTGPNVTGVGLVLNISPASPRLGDNLTASGSLAPLSLNPATITIRAWKPDQNVQTDQPAIVETVTTNQISGNFSKLLGVADISGVWTIRAEWGGGGSFSPQSETITVNVGGLAIPLTSGRVDMISLTVVPVDGNPAEIFGGDSQARKLNLTLWSPGLAKYLQYPADSINLSGGSGFWIRPTTTETVYANGQIWPQTEPYTIPLTTGWNQIGTVYVTPVTLSRSRVRYQGITMTLADAAASGWIRDYAWGYNATTRQYFLVKSDAPVKTLDPKRGYWIRALVDCELILQP